MDPGPYSMGVYILWHIKDMDPRHKIWTPGSIIYGGGPYSIIEYGSPGPYSIGNMDPGSIFHGIHILYDTGSGRQCTDMLCRQCSQARGCSAGEAGRSVAVV